MGRPAADGAQLRRRPPLSLRRAGAGVAPARQDQPRRGPLMKPALLSLAAVVAAVAATGTARAQTVIVPAPPVAVAPVYPAAGVAVRTPGLSIGIATAPVG